MKKYHMILIVALGISSFGASFGFNWFRQQKAADAAVVPSEQSTAHPGLTKPAAQNSYQDAPSDWQLSGSGDEQGGLTERQLQHLIYDVREKMREHTLREQAMAEEARRIELARQSLQEDVEQLNQLQENLDMRLASLNEKEEKLEQLLVTIDTVERGNLRRLASTYDRMDAVQAGVIMINMAGNNQLDDVVKILYYMSDRNAARVLGEIGNSDPDTAAALSQHLKRVQEGD